MHQMTLFGNPDKKNAQLGHRSIWLRRISKRFVEIALRIFVPLDEKNSLSDSWVRNLL